MATTCSSGLNSLLSGSKVTQTTLPNWYTTAQQNLVNTAGKALSGAPTGIGQTTAQNAVNTLNAPANPFSMAACALGTIAKGAADPFTTSAQGITTPNTNTPLGGLFAAQRQQLCQLLPQTLAQFKLVTLVLVTSVVCVAKLHLILLKLMRLIL